MIEEIIYYAKEYNIPIIDDEGLAFLLDKIDEYQVKNILEIGSAIGYSAIMMANHNHSIQITTIEKDIKRYAMAVENLKQIGLNKQVDIINLDANDYQSDKLFDLIFLDGPKSQYDNMLNKLYDNLKYKGIVIVDNLGFHGLVFQEKPKLRRRTRKLVEKIKLFRENVNKDNRFDVKLYDNIGDGMGLLIKKEDVKNGKF